MRTQTILSLLFALQCSVGGCAAGRRSEGFRGRNVERGEVGDMVAREEGDMEIDMVIGFPGVLRARASTAAAGGANLFAFTSTNLGGQTLEPVTNSGAAGRPFAAGGNTFTTFAEAASRACDDQQQECSRFANENKNAGFKVSDCQAQLTSCKAAASTGTPSSGGQSTTSTTSSTSTTTSTTSTTSSSTTSIALTTSTSSSTSTTTSIPPVETTSATSTTTAAAAAPPPLAVQLTTSIPLAASSAVSTETGILGGGLPIAGTATTSAFEVLGTLHSSDENFFYFCDS